MTAAAKDTLYIDIEDEITAVIDKVVHAKHKIVAVVLPKHASVFQSTVNLKLLKKAAQGSKKNLVLITSDKAVLAIAAGVGLHVAKTLSSKPAIPIVAPAAHTGEVEAESLESDGEPEADTIGDAEVEEDAIELDNTPAAAAGTGMAAKAKKHLMKIPDFSKFSVRLTLGIAAVLLLITGWVFGFVVLPKATITINTDTSTLPVASQFVARIGVDTLDLENNIVPAKRALVEKIDTVTVAATGQKNIGERATGSMNLTNCIKSDGAQVVPAGTRFSVNDVTFESTEQAILPEATFNFSGQCRSKENGDDKTVKVIALEAGEKFNVSAQTYNSAISGIVAVGSAMSGGSTKVVTIISAEDVQKAEDQLKGSSKEQALTELREQLRTQGVEPLEQTVGEGAPKTDVTPAVGAEAPEVKVTVTISYNLTGVARNDISQLLDSEVRKKLGDSQQNVRDNGLEDVKYQLTESPNDADRNLTIETIAKIGPELNEAALREQAAGKKRGEIENEFEAIEGVRSVSVEYSPVWITTTPKSADKIVIVFVEDDGEQ